MDCGEKLCGNMVIFSCAGRFGEYGYGNCRNTCTKSFSVPSSSTRADRDPGMCSSSSKVLLPAAATSQPALTSLSDSVRHSVTVTLPALLHPAVTILAKQAAPAEGATLRPTTRPANPIRQPIQKDEIAGLEVPSDHSTRRAEAIALPCSSAVVTARLFLDEVASRSDFVAGEAGIAFVPQRFGRTLG